MLIHSISNMGYTSLNSLFGRNSLPVLNQPVASSTSIVHELPVEILQDIFTRYCTIDIQQYADDAKRYKREARAFPPFHPDQLRCRLSLVCRRWASILKKTPRVWTQLIILDYIPRKVTMERWLNWSEPFPLELLILLWEPQRDVMVEELMRLLSPHISRLRILIAEFSRDNPFRDVLTRHLFPAGSVIEMPELEILYLHQSFPPPTLPAMGTIISPKLSKFTLLSGYKSGIASFLGERLDYVHLVLTDDTARDFSLLSRSKLVRTLNVEFNESPTTVPDIHFCLTHLTTLKLAIQLPSNEFAWNDFSALFERLQFPALEILDISVLGYLRHLDATPPIRSLLFNKSPHIKELACSQLRLGPDFYETLAYLQELKRLSMLGCIIEERFFKSFTELSPSSIVSGYLCPALEDIQFAPRVKFSLSDLEQLLKLRGNIVVLMTVLDFEMDVNDATILMSFDEYYSQFALAGEGINWFNTDESSFPVKYLGKAFSLIRLLSGLGS
ncbi:hypothetical protein Clacol_007440 [Clathrus columnatus]|uniref:F-box domain-containing protein n=1 Tax=Clathrus columnatus TaxID=1419009 RepID=A0AAV5AJ83_9AGAM|nr:hypothetical protein Clacol_007440 [Clathrus columnatus]